jgi:cation:H+ antiporter
VWALQLLAGLVVLTIGAEVLIRNAVKLSLAARISPLVVGLTVVAFGTSAPELVVSVQSALGGVPDIALGNAVGSNTLNVLVILGLSAVITPLSVDVKLIRFDVPLMIVAAVLLWIVSADGLLSRLDGLLFVAGLISFITFSVVSARRNHAVQTHEQFTREFGRKPVEATAGRVALWIGLIVAGLVLLVIGAQLFTSGAIAIARRLGVSELVIGLTIVSIGTSLPELATSVMAAWKGERDIAVGNVVGSNLFNILCVLGITASVAPAGIPVSSAALHLDLPVMIAACLACLPIFFTGHRIDRWEGWLFLAYYAAYVAALFFIATESPLLNTYTLAMLGFVVPLTVLTLVITAFRAWRRQKRKLRSE